MVPLGDELKWKLISVHLKIVLILTKDRSTVCVEHTTARKSFWMHPMEFIGDVGHWWGKGLFLIFWWVWINSIWGGFDIGCLTTTTTRLLRLSNRYTGSDCDVLVVPRTPWTYKQPRTSKNKMNKQITHGFQPKAESESQVGDLKQTNRVV